MSGASVTVGQRRWRTAVLGFAALVVGGGCAPPAADWAQDLGDLEVSAYRTGSTNIFALVSDGESTLIDIGEQGALDTLEPRLAQDATPIESFDRMLLTHAHYDHAGAAQALAARGVPVWVHVGDGDMIRSGVDREAEIIGEEAALIDAVIDQTFPECEPDHTFDQGFALHDERVVAVPVGGHTKGSVAFVVDESVLLVGDLVRGGNLGGAFNAETPLVHYFHEDKARAHAMLRALFDDHPGVETIYPAHGGPFTRAAMDTFLAELDTP